MGSIDACREMATMTAGLRSASVRRPSGSASSKLSGARVDARSALSHALSADAQSCRTRRLTLRNGRLAKSRRQPWSGCNGPALPRASSPMGKDLCERDPQLQARNFWGTVTLPDGHGPIRRALRRGSRQRRDRSARRRRLIGSSNDYVLGELLGLSRAERDALVDGQGCLARLGWHGPPARYLRTSLRNLFYCRTIDVWRTWRCLRFGNRALASVST